MKEWKCSVCDLEFDTRKQIRDHLIEHQREGRIHYGKGMGGNPKRFYCRRWNGKMWVAMRIAKELKN
jgi:hypothetical protein